MPYYQGDYYRGDYYQGDFLGLGRTLKKATAFVGHLGIPVVSTIANDANRVLNAISPNAAAATSAGPPAPPNLSIMRAPPPPTLGTVAVGVGSAGPFSGIAAGYTTGLPPGFTNPGGPGTAVVPAGGGYGGDVAGKIYAKMLKGYHLNRSTYVTRGGGQLTLHPAHSGLVRNRSMNPGNSRALRHALRRAYAFERLAMRTIKLIHPRKHGKFGGFKKGRRR